MANLFLPRINADHPDGVLDRMQRLRLTAAMLVARWMRRRRKHRPRNELQSELSNPLLWKAVEQPRGRLAAHVWKVAEAHQPAWLVNHCLRTDAWGQVLGVIGGLSFDREALFAAAMLHDVGLTALAAMPPEHCFAIRGARYAMQTLDGVTDSQTVQLVAQAIARHIDLQVDERDGVEAHLLHAGAIADVLGRNMTRIPEPVRRHIVSWHPRMGMKEALCRCMLRESTAAPHSRAACYVRQIGFVDLIRQAPFDE